MNALILIIAALTPYFASVLLFGLPNIHTTLLPLIERYFYFLLVPTLWQLSLAAAEFFMRSRPAGNRARIGLSASLLVLLTLTSLFALQIIKLRLSTGFFVLILASIGVESIAVVLRKRGAAYQALMTLVVSDVLIAQCSFLLFGAAGWQSLVFSIGLALQLCSYRLAAEMIGIKPRLIDFLPEGVADHAYVPAPGPIQKFYLLSLIAGIIFTSVLSMLGQVQTRYLLLYLLLPLVIRLADEYRKSSADPRQIPEFRAKNSGILIAILVMIAALTQLM